MNEKKMPKNFLLFEMECIVCTEITTKGNRVVCEQCLKPTCNDCHSKSSNLCGNCRDQFPKKLLAFDNELLKMAMKCLSTPCKMNRFGIKSTKITPCNGELVFCTVPGANDVIFACDHHSYNCQTCHDLHEIKELDYCETCGKIVCREHMSCALRR